MNTAPSWPADLVNPPEPLGGRVLVVDDELPNRAYLKKILVARGCEVLEAQDGIRALELARTYRPDLALVDVMMPGMSGYEVCQAIKTDAILKEIPVIMVTARTDIEDIERGFLVGAFDYIRKPFNPRELVVRVRNALLLKRSTEEVRLWKQKMSHELEVAGSLQQKLLATRPLLTELFEVRSIFQPSMNIGGDVFDVIPLEDGGLAVYVGDVSGHGVGPAMISSMLKVMLADLIAERTAQGPAAICTALNVRFRQQVDNPEVYATLFLALYRPTTGHWQCLNCGHPPPLFFPRRDQPAQLLDERGDLPIGLLDENGPGYAKASEMAITATPGTVLFFYTDGLTEARQTTGEELGATRLAQTVEGLLHEMLAPNLPERVLASVRAAGYSLETDDCTALVVEQVPTDEVKLTRAILPEHRYVAELAVDCERILLAQGWSDEAVTAARLLVTEHAANIVDHGQLPPQATMACQLRVRDRMARFLFRDTGRDWHFENQLQWTSKCAADATRGRGLSIIHAIAKHAELFRRGQENIAFYLLSADFSVKDEQATVDRRDLL